MSWECRLGFRPQDLRLRPTYCGLGNRFQSHQTRSSQPLGWVGAGCLAFRRDLACFPPVEIIFLRAAFAQSRRLATSFSFRVLFQRQFTDKRLTAWLRVGPLSLFLFV